MNKELAVRRAAQKALALPETPSGEDDFFALGGDSLAAAEFLILLEEEGFGRFTLAELFENSQIRAFAELGSEVDRRPLPPNMTEVPRLTMPKSLEELLLTVTALAGTTATAAEAPPIASGLDSLALAELAETLTQCAAGSLDELDVLTATSWSDVWRMINHEN